MKLGSSSDRYFTFLGFGLCGSLSVGKLSEDGVIPYICHCLTTMCQKVEISKDKVFVIFLGQKYHANLNANVRILPDFINQEPTKASASPQHRQG